jgi:hypothetical protein
MQFRGHATLLDLGVLVARATAPSSTLVTEIDGLGVRGTLETHGGGEAHLECRYTFIDDRRFSELGTISFGSGNALRFHSKADGSIGRCADPALRHGAITLEIDSGSGALGDATGRIVSNFLLSDTGELTDNHLVVAFLGRKSA